MDIKGSVGGGEDVESTYRENTVFEIWILKRHGGGSEGR